MPASGPEQLRLIAARCKAVGDGGLMRQVRADLRVQAAPMIAAARSAARQQLPKSGGLAEYEASQKIRVSTLAGVRTAGVRIVGKASNQTDTGTWRHPVPRARRWTTQTYNPAAGWWSRTLTAQGPVVAAGMRRTLQAAADEIAAGA